MSPAVVAVVAHPDDESMIAGGTLALAAQAGMSTGVVSLTRGELGPISDPALATREQLGAVRAAELEGAATELALDWAVCLSHPDGELPWVDAEAAARELARLLAPRGVDVVLTFGEDGVYWHPDHAACGRIARLAAQRLDPPAQVYEAVWPSGVMTELCAAAAARGLPHALWGLEPAAFGSAQGASVTLDVRAVLARKLAAMRSHRTQLSDDHLLAALPPDLAERYLGQEMWAGPARTLVERLGHG